MSSAALKTVSDPVDIITATSDEVVCLEKCYPLHYRIFRELLKIGKAKIEDQSVQEGKC